MNSTAVSRSRTPQSAKPGQPKPGVKFSKVNRVQSEDGEEEDDDSCIDSEVSSDSSMSANRPRMEGQAKVQEGIQDPNSINHTSDHQSGATD